MSVPDHTGVSEKIGQSEQYILNYSFDQAYKILMVGLAGYNPTTGNYDRIQTNNSSGGMVTSDTTLQGLVQQLIDVASSLRDAQNNIPYARDSSDQLRVSSVASVNGMLWGSSNSEPTYYSTGAPTSMDAREQMEEMSLVNFNTMRTGRWVIT